MVFSYLEEADSINLLISVLSWMMEPLALLVFYKCDVAGLIG